MFAVLNAVGRVLYRRVRQDGPQGPGGDSRGDGAADDLYHKGRRPGESTNDVTLANGVDH